MFFFPLLARRKKRKTAEREREESNQRFQTLIDNSLSCISIIRNDKKVYLNPGLRKIHRLITRAFKPPGFENIYEEDRERIKKFYIDLVTGKIGKTGSRDSKSVDINEAVKCTLHLMQEKIKTKNIKLTVNTTEQPVCLNIIPDDLDIILTNLIDNAVKYTQKDGAITINNYSTDDKIMIEVSDTGIGVHKDDVNKIFDEFYRASNAKAVELDGTGLGLTIVKNLVKRHGGNIDVNSELGKGTTVTVSFPV